MVDEATKKTLNRIPLLKTRACPRDGEQWVARLREELHALIDYVKINKQNDSDWVEIHSNPEGTKWHGHCWHIHSHERYQFDFEFEIPAAYPDAPPEIAIPTLDGRTAKMYRGGFICLSDHFKPLWSKNAPKFGIAHALALGLGPWLAVEVPDLIARGLIEPKRNESNGNGDANSNSNAAASHS